VIGLGADLRCDQANGENAARSAHALLKNGAAVRGSRLKIAPDMAGMLEVIRSPQQKRAVRSHWREWRSTAVGVGPGPAESATGPMEKMPHCGGDAHVQPHTVERRAGSCLGRHPPSDFKLS
jgi:hypothetical protein